jgi:hypothetical protein
MQPPTTSYHHGYNTYRRGSSISVKSYFLLPIPLMGGENLSLYAPYRALFCHRSPSREDTTRTVLHDLGDSALSTRPRPSLDPASTYHRSAGRKGRRSTGLRVFSPSCPLRHHGVQGWPAIPGARRYAHLHRDRQNFTSEAPASLPPLTL